MANYGFGTGVITGDTPDFPTYSPYREKAPEPTFAGMPKEPKIGEFPGGEDLPTYQAGGAGAYPITELPIYQRTAEAYPQYAAPETGGVGEALQQTILSRMTGEGTAGAESAIYERAEESMQRQHEEGLRRIDEEMSARGLTGSGIHGEAVSKLEEERQRSMADLSRQVTIYGQEAIESSMGRATQYVEQQAAEAARELQAKERGYGARVAESVKEYESSARAAEAKGQSQQAAYQTAIAERVRAYESQARATSAKNEMSIAKWTAEANVHMKKYQMQLQKAEMLQQAKMTAWQSGKEEHQRVYEARYRATKDKYLAEQAAREAAERKAMDEWNRKQAEIERQMKFEMARGPEPQISPAWGDLGGYTAAWQDWQRGVNVAAEAQAGWSV